MVREIEIVIRGGPASGKTTALALIVPALREAGCSISYHELPASRERAINKTIDKIDRDLVQPMKVTIIEEVTDGNSTPSSGQ